MKSAHRALALLAGIWLAAALPAAATRAPVALPFQIVDGRIVLAVRLDGKGPFRFALTADGGSAVGSDAARGLGVASHGAAIVVDRLDLGALVLRRQKLAIETSEPSVDGRLGLDAFRDVVARFDFARRELTLLDPDTFVYRGSGDVVPLYDVSGRLVVNGTVDGDAARFRFDLGGSEPLVLSTAFSANHPARPDAGGIRHVRVEDVDLGQMAADTGGIRGVSGALGDGVWQRFTLVVDLPGRVVILERLPTDKAR